MTSHITIAPSLNRVRVRLAGTVIAGSDGALVLTEGRSGPVLYVPRTDVRWELFGKSARRSHCPYKGDASYYDVTVDGTTKANVVWSYETPLADVAAIKDHLAFYPDKVDGIEELPKT